MASYYSGSSYYGSSPRSSGIGQIPRTTRYAPPAEGGAPTEPRPAAYPPLSPTSAPAPAAATPGFNLGSLDYSNDPILARIRALGQQSIADAEAEALRQRTQLAIGYGDPQLAKKLGLSGDVRDQAKGNAFGTMQELGRAYTRRNTFEIDAPLSDHANLFYSSERGRQRALSGEQDLRDHAQAQSQVQERLAAISQAVLQAKLAAQAQEIQAEQEAYQRALQMALYSAGG